MLSLHEIASACLIAGIFFAAGLLPFQEPEVDPTGPATSLRGLTREQVIDRLGVPLSVSGAADAISFRYAEDGEEGLEVVFHHDVAVLVVNPSAMPESRGPAPSDEIYLGQPVGEFARRSGMPEGYSLGSLGLYLELDSSEVTLINGVVAGIEPSR